MISGGFKLFALLIAAIMSIGRCITHVLRFSCMAAVVDTGFAVNGAHLARSTNLGDRVELDIAVTMR